MSKPKVTLIILSGLFLLLLGGCWFWHWSGEPFKPDERLEPFLREPGYNLENPCLTIDGRIFYQRSTCFDVDTIIKDTNPEVWVTREDTTTKKKVRSNCRLFAASDDGRMLALDTSLVGTPIVLTDSLGNTLRVIEISELTIIVRFGKGGNWLFFTLADKADIYRINLTSPSSQPELVLSDVVEYDLMPDDSAFIYRKDLKLSRYSFAARQAYPIVEQGGPNSTGFRVNPKWPQLLVQVVEGGAQFAYSPINLVILNTENLKKMTVDGRPYDGATVIGYESRWTFDGRSLFYQVQNWANGDPMIPKEYEIWRIQDIVDGPF